MSESELTKSTMTNESSIPVLKRNLTGTKKSKGCSKVPELQKYIETIIKASKDFDIECASLPDKEKFPKHFIKHTFSGGYENKLKQDKHKNDVISNGRKYKRQTSKKKSAAVSSTVDVSHTFFSEFEDPRNCKIQITRSHLKMEQLIKKLYPNPYKVNCQNDLKNSETHLIFQKVNKDVLEDETSYDVLISKVGGDIEEDFEKGDTDLVSDDIQIITSERENKTTNDNLNENSLRFRNKTGHQESKSNKSSNSLKTLRDSQKSSIATHSNCTSNVSSRVTSMESVNQVTIKESKTHFKKVDKVVEDPTISLKQASTKKAKSKHSIVNDKKVLDCDIGKLKLLNLSDSDDAKRDETPKAQTDNKDNNIIDTDDYVTEISSEICNEISKTNDVNDLLQIYEVMNKATESFLYLTSMKKPVFENKKSVETLKNEEVNSKTDEEAKSSKRKSTKNVKNEKHSDTKETKSEGGKKEESHNQAKNQKTNITENETDEKTYSDEETEKLDLDSEKDIVESVKVCGGIEQKIEEEIFDANRKISEVLQFMNECLLRFSNDEKLLRKKSEEGTKKSLSDNALKSTLKDIKPEPPLTTLEFMTSTYDFGEEDSTENFSRKDFLNSEDTESIRMTPETSEDHHNRILPTTTQSQQLLVNNDDTISLNIFPPVYTESVALNIENTIQIAEGQNELGGYLESSTVSNDRRVLKTLLPLTKKIKRNQPQTYKTLKEALETEEKLLAREFKIPENSEMISYKSETQILLQNDPKCYSPVGGSSSFVICISPFPQNIGAATVIPPTLSLTKPLSLSLLELRSWDINPTQPEKLYFRMEYFQPHQIESRAKVHKYGFKLEIMLVSVKKIVYNEARKVSFATVINMPRVQREFLLQTSRCFRRIKPVKKSSPLKSNISGIRFTSKNTITSTVDKSKYYREDISRKEKSVEALLKAIQETESALAQQQTTSRQLGNFESFCSCRSKEILRNESYEQETEKEDNKKKVEDLLLRTYNLQNKLQQYLNNLCQVQPISPWPFIIKRDFGVSVTEKTDFYEESRTNLGKKSEKSSTRLQQSIERCTKTDEAVSVNVPMVDHATVYSPPKEEQPKTVDEKSEESEYNKDNLFYLENEEQLNIENDDDDRSSTYSFKSSNDFSETNEVQTVTKESSPHVTNRDVLQKIFSEIELLKQTVDAEALEKQEKKHTDNNAANSNSKDENDNRLVEYDPKSPAKVLKTVFKGRKSSTELTIGLKDVPMTKVSNISVEKTKFSPNHTKISIWISKEKPSTVEITDSDKLNTNMLTNKVSSYFFDRMRPSLSTCQAEYSKLEDDGSRSSQSLNENTDDDEDDFKSVHSSAANLSTGSDSQDKLKIKTPPTVKISSAKNYTKHKFDFYRKMDLNVEGVRVRQKPITNFLGRYKELEPLKQALTELQIRMRSIKREAVMNSNDYYERALKLAKMSAGYCQSCGTRTVIPNDTFGYYKSLLPRRNAQHRRNRHFKTAITPNSSFYSFQSSNAEVSGEFCNSDIKQSSSFLLNQTTHSNRTVLRSSLQDMPILFEKM